MTENTILKWIKVNLAPAINEAIAGTTYTEDWLAAMACRETGQLIARYYNMKPADAFALMKGDYTQREGETEKQYHGFSCFQIDIASFPDFVKSGAWKDPHASAMKCVSVLEGKRKYIQSHIPMLPVETLDHAITAAYNCGEGNVLKVLANKSDIDSRTANHNYSADVWRLREIYKTIE